MYLYYCENVKGDNEVKEFITIILWEAYQHLTDKLYDHFRFHKIKVEPDPDNWAITNKIILDFVNGFI